MHHSLPPLYLPLTSWLQAHHLPHINLNQLLLWHTQGSNIPEKLADLSRKTDLDQDLAWQQKRGCHLIAFDDLRYPVLLKHIPNPPLILYVKGNPIYLNAPQVCLVGSRHATQTGLKQSFNLAHYLSQLGFCITSGLALGIDGQAHLGALKAHSPTIAVLGHGLQTLHPKRHHTLSERIIEQGCLLSTYPIGTPIRPYQFPQRNHIMSGLSLATCVIEARAKSGSLISAYAAVDMNREVMTLLRPKGLEAASGNAKLIDEGAISVSSFDQIPPILEKTKEDLALLRYQQLETTALHLICEKPRTLKILQENMYTNQDTLHCILDRLIKHQLIHQVNGWYHWKTSHKETVEV